MAMSESAAAAAAMAPAGWYADPYGRDGQRYWDGSTWTAHFAPATEPAGSRARTGDWVGGVLLSIFIPLIGLIAGAVYVGKGGTKRHVGIMCLVISGSLILLCALVSATGA
jgi:hypothetical protein